MMPCAWRIRFKSSGYAFAISGFWSTVRSKFNRSRRLSPAFWSSTTPLAPKYGRRRSHFLSSFPASWPWGRCWCLSLRGSCTMNLHGPSTSISALICRWSVDTSLTRFVTCQVLTKREIILTSYLDLHRSAQVRFLLFPWIYRSVRGHRHWQARYWIRPYIGCHPRDHLDSGVRGNICPARKYTGNDRRYCMSCFVSYCLD